MSTTSDRVVNGSEARFRTELELVSRLLRELPRIFAEPIHATTEVRSHGTARTDVVLVTPKEIIGIEAKISDWSRVLAQAFLNRLCYDRSYVAVDPAALTTDRLREARRHGIGVIAVSESTVELVRSARKTNPIAALRREIAARIVGDVP